MGAASLRSPAPSPKCSSAKAGRPAAAQAPALVGSPLHPPQLSSALHPGLCQVGAEEWLLNPFTSQEPPQPCAYPKETITWAQPHPSPPSPQASLDLPLNSLSCSPTSVLLTMPSGLRASGLCRHLGSLVAWLPWHHGSRSGGTTALGNQGRQGLGPSSYHSSALRPLSPSPSRAEEAMRRKRKLPRRAALYL